MKNNKFQELTLHALQVLLIGNAGQETRDELIKKIQVEVSKE